MSDDVKAKLTALLMGYDRQMTFERADALREAATLFDGAYAAGIMFAAELLDGQLRGES